MLTPDWLDYQLDRLKISRDLEEGIIRDIARRITKTGYVTETADWQAERARQAGILREDVIKRVAASSKKSEREIRQLFKEAKLLIFDGSDTPTRGMNHIWNAALRKTCTTADNLTKTIAITSQKTYIEAADLAHMEIMSGAFTYDQAITNAIKKAAKDGAKVKYPSGAVTSVEAAVRRTVLTGVNQTSGKLCEMRCDELRCDLVEVSAHYGARPSHAEWQGGVYSRSGRHPEYESLVDATGYGTGEGLMGWNCNHSMAPFFEGMSKRNYTEEQLRDMREHTVTYNGKEITDYEASQIQRGFERKIRQSKNRLIALDEQGKVSPSDKQKNAFAAESVRLKAREGKLKDFCKQTGRRSDSLRTRTASWNRSTSQKAVWQNRRLQSAKNSGIVKVETVSRYVNSTDALFVNAKNIKPIKGFEDIVIHGDKYGFEIKALSGKTASVYSPREFAVILKEDPNYHGGNIRLIACETGADGSTAAQLLANQLDVEIMAPTDIVWVFPNGEMVVGPNEFENTGGWKIFKPKGE